MKGTQQEPINIRRSCKKFGCPCELSSRVSAIMNCKISRNKGVWFKLTNYFMILQEK